MERRRKIERAGQRSGQNILQELAAAALFLILCPALAGADSAAVHIAARYGARTAHIQTIGHLFNGKTEVESGSGLLIGDHYVLTDNHVIPPSTNYKSREISVRLLSRKKNPIRVKSVVRDKTDDLALLELEHSASGSGGPNRCPMPVIAEADEAPMGTQLYLMGFPLDQDLSITSGLISNQGEPDRWQTDAVMDPGNSGGPAFNEYGALIGVAVGGIVQWESQGQTTPVYGVNFIIPATAIVTSRLYPIISKLPSPSSCWTSWDSTKVLPSNLFHIVSHPVMKKILLEKTIPEIVSSLQKEPSSNEGLTKDLTHGMDVLKWKRFITNVPANKLTPPATLNRAYTLSQTKDDHPSAEPSSRTYSQTFRAEPGYLITRCGWHAETANQADRISCKIAPKRTSAVFSFRLTSGPFLHRWRAWWGGSVTLTQSPVLK